MADSDAEEEHEAWQCLLPGGKRARPTLMGSQSASAPLSVSLPLTFREEKYCFAWQDGSSRPGALQPLQVPMAEPTTSQTPLHPQALAQWGPLRLCLQLLLTSDCTAILRHIAFPVLLEKNAFLCEMSRRSLPSDTPFHYYLLFLQQLPSKLRLHIQTENTSTIQRHTELPNSGSV